MSRSVNLPNALTTMRVLLAPLVAALLFQPRASARLVAGIVYVVAAVSDLIDGEIARRRGEITDFGKLVDPIADKLLLAATLVPFWILTSRHPELGGLPLFGGVPLWTLLVFFGRELLVTVLRTRAARNGIVVPSMPIGKYKAAAQSVFSGSMIAWLALQTAAIESGWNGATFRAWESFHGWFTTLTLILALILTVLSLFVYLEAFRRIEKEKTA
ncbi:MAG: CDP-alcohol phosphatidyltransferase family protein [marine benthic group bacterium]|nr:CDP-alcohol phosphatidyltransferase family protein [Gemmatimonadota bacterium]MCL7937659.1 CDP-alcohol phosphatidyltransferase family protein [Gemmatimonadota bacterium]MCL7967860.1 CDP-alcohol phosphatidyltransferase family protein [Gemmatimonadota bacterium]MCL7974093.1 CDP-alcohol phosphatidyltransferase family protein [Gemmatimonadota bacterium]MCL7978052.1 CDP-alcohol phosphatidyltransferase family protein [Gemmatimonadota bacterium]